MKYQYFILLIFLSFSVSLLESEKSIRLFSSKQITKKQLKKEIVERMERVDELREIRKLAGELGIKHVYLFGGSAAAWAHYVYWDLEREAGMGNYHESRFDYDYTSIFRSNQDMDIVVDIDEDNAGLIRKFESQLQEHFPHFQGNKPAWEVRPLRFSYGGKDQILDNPDFLAQNSDSHSTGLISVTDHDKMRIRDFKDWDNENNHFFEDVYNRELHFYRDQKMHEATERFKRGLNPEIFSVIRYLTKAFQYELAIDEESFIQLEDIIAKFDKNKDLKESYSQSWIEKNAKKLYQNAISLEFSYHTMRKFNLPEILSKINDRPEHIGSLSWWMRRMPLLSKPIEHSPQENGQVTARDLGLDIVAHETKSFEAYESITKSHSGDANVFISREGMAAETAAHGDGFYTQIGKEGAVGSGLTIRFKVNPDAIEGIDFIKGPNDFIVFLNKNAIEVIPESLNISAVEYFEKIAAGDLIFDYTDKGVQEKVSRKVGLKLNNLSVEEEEAIVKILNDNISNKKFNKLMYSEWFKSSSSVKYPQVLDSIIIKDKHHLNKFLINYVFAHDHWANYEDLEKLLGKWRNRKKLHYTILRKILKHEMWRNHPYIETIVEKYIKRSRYYVKAFEDGSGFHTFGTNAYDFLEIVELYDWYDHPKMREWLLKFLGRVHLVVLGDLVANKELRDKVDGLNIILKSIERKRWVFSGVIIRALEYYNVSLNEPEIELTLNKLLDFNRISKKSLSNILSRPHNINTAAAVRVLEKAIHKGFFNRDTLLKFFHSRSPFYNNEKLIKALLRSQKDREYIKEYLILRNPTWRNNTMMLDFLAMEEKRLEKRNRCLNELALMITW